ncbi:unknown [Clostridium sp. CAG:678]|jgi:hypothetical protein|nr:unknown [Clostridium sp. CAG:678]
MIIILILGGIAIHITQICLTIYLLLGGEIKFFDSIVFSFKGLFSEELKGIIHDWNENCNRNF